MNFEFCELTNNTIKQLIDYDFSKVDRLFLEVKTFNKKYLNIDLDFEHLLNNPQIVLIERKASQYNIKLPKKHTLVSIKNLQVQIIENNYLYNNYNFINAFDLQVADIMPHLIPNKVNIIFGNSWDLFNLNDNLRKIGSTNFVDILIESCWDSHVSHYQSIDGMVIITNWQLMDFNIHRIQLIDDKIYLHCLSTGNNIYQDCVCNYMKYNI